MAMDGRLAEMVAHKRAHVPRGLRPPAAALAPVPPSLEAALRQARELLERATGGDGRPEVLPIVAEVKRRSPSAGLIAPQADAADKARRYVAARAAAISVLADETFFGGSPADVEAVVRAVRRPVLFKDIVVCPEQLEAARATGASAVLLIVAALPAAELAELFERASSLGLEALVEVHDERDLATALALPGIRMIGVNNRDLRTFRVDPATAARLVPAIPPGILRVAESGYGSAQSIARAWTDGADAVLVGEALMRSEDPAMLLQDAAARYAAARVAGGARMLA